jgi:hypothetical protein
MRRSVCAEILARCRDVTASIARTEPKPHRRTFSLACLLAQGT